MHFASKKNITLLIENNVLSLKNYNEFGQNILLMVDHKESAEIMNEINLRKCKDAYRCCTFKGFI